MENKKKTDSFVSIKCFVAALIIIAVMMVLCFVATKVIPCQGISFGKWILSPLLVLGGEDQVTLIAVILFLIIIGGVFNALTGFGVMNYMVDKISAKYADKKYKLMAAVILFFMAMGSLIGSFEEVVPMVPILVALAIRLGWDAFTGLSMSLLAVGCGFAAGVFNPFTIGIANELAGLPIFSGALFRAFNFIFIYGLLWLFVSKHAKKIDSGAQTVGEKDFQKEPKKDRAVVLFASIVGFGILLVLSSAFLTVLRDYTFVIVTVMFLIAGIVSCRVAGMKRSELGRYFLAGSVSMLPAVLMILMASSIKFTLQTAGIFDIIVNGAVRIASGLPRWAIILFIYLIALVMNFFVASGSAKAVMLIPLLVPMATALGISPQLVIVAYAFGDGFSNVFYPTNPALLISLGLADTSYSKWFRYSGPFQLLNLVLTSLLLLLGLAIGV